VVRPVTLVPFTDTHRLQQVGCPLHWMDALTHSFVYSGASGKVSLVMMQTSGAFAAMKTIAFGSAKSKAESVVKSLEREVGILSRHPHPHIVGFYGGVLGEDGMEVSLFLVRDLMCGMDLLPWTCFTPEPIATEARRSCTFSLICAHIAVPSCRSTWRLEAYSRSWRLAADCQHPWCRRTHAKSLRGSCSCTNMACCTATSRYVLCSGIVYSVTGLFVLLSHSSTGWSNCRREISWSKAMGSSSLRTLGLHGSFETLGRRAT
jgi:hypothetical protein